MGNCMFKGIGVSDQGRSVIKIVTPNGGVMELQAPIAAESITNEFPGHGLFPAPAHRTSNAASLPPLHHHDYLSPGHSYYLLPILLQDHHDNDDMPSSVDSTPYRMSVDSQQQQGTSSALSSFKNKHSAAAAAAAASPGAGGAAFPRPGKRHQQQGVWKVRLAINSDQLSEIFSQDARTEALIESVRTVAKCANAAPSPPAEDQRSWTSYASAADQ